MHSSLTALRGGLCNGELIALQWGDVQFGESENDSNRYILGQRNFSCGCFTTPKSEKSDVSIYPDTSEQR